LDAGLITGDVASLCAAQTGKPHNKALATSRETVFGDSFISFVSSKSYQAIRKERIYLG
jgi:hypothetical protein